jgi:hypothetical protein
MSPISVEFIWLLGSNDVPFGAFLAAIVSADRLLLIAVVGTWWLVARVIYLRLAAGYGRGANLADQALRLRKGGYTADEAVRLLNPHVGGPVMTPDSSQSQPRHDRDH